MNTRKAPCQLCGQETDQPLDDLKSPVICFGCREKLSSGYGNKLAAEIRGLIVEFGEQYNFLIIKPSSCDRSIAQVYDECIKKLSKILLPSKNDIYKNYNRLITLLKEYFSIMDEIEFNYDNDEIINEIPNTELGRAAIAAETALRGFIKEG